MPPQLSFLSNIRRITLEGEILVSLCLILHHEFTANAHHAFAAKLHHLNG
jgi:hypothetical protein